MKRIEHSEQIQRWANFVRDNPNKWKPIHTEFINAIFEKQDEFLKEMKKTKEGRDKLKKLSALKKRNREHR